MGEISLFMSILALTISTLFALFGDKVKEYSKALSRSRTAPPPLPKDNWVRDGSKPPRDADNKFLSETVLIVLDSGRKGSGWWRFDRGCWVARPNGCNSITTPKIRAWQKFPDYEKI